MVAVIDAQSKAKGQGKRAAGPPKAGKGGALSASGAGKVRGAAVAKLLTSGLGLSVLDAGSGQNGTSWD